MIHYRILLEERKKKQSTELTIPADSILEELSAHIKASLLLPYLDEGWHYFQAFGVTYMTTAMAVVDEEIRGECELSIPNEYRNSETVKVSDLFTTIGSCFVYVQESMTGSSNLKVTCTLLERIEFEDSE